MIIFDLCFIGSVGFNNHLAGSSPAGILFASADLLLVVVPTDTNDLVRISKNSFLSIHKPPASNRLAPMEHALTVSVEPFKFSPA